MTESPMDRPSTVIAVVPTFVPDVGVLERLRSLAQQVDSIIVVDDGSPERASVVLDSIDAAGFELIRTGRNSGIASALNTGTRLALERGAHFVLTLDQDSLLPPDYVADCLHAFSLAAPETKVGVVCADRINGAPSIPGSYTPEGLGVVREAIQSGFVIRREVLEQCGLFDARLFIDDVDTEFCLRIARHGWLTVVGPGTDITHSLGEQALLRPFGLQRYINGEPARYQYHRPFRRYYITRNNIDLYLRYLRSSPRWVLSSVRRELSPTFTTIVSGPHRLRHLLAASVGLVHGLARHRGPLSPALAKVLTPGR
ncbi:glycosyltransferase [Lacisediminihabitans changchengi]|uniref:Glycosyltransferase n=1 Tax=Lacisediminihabitans changchengi TaxID=2787634 RepID=A0A934SJG6_9MICO|nr:glycosyltransferase [Lacisediminihabitans changchengi]MBK4346420.1 glycosyltransferase [Lacisediminihabitans changchengi]